MTDNYEKLSIAVSDFIMKEIDESLTDHIIEAVKNHNLLTDTNILYALTSHIEERVCEEIEDCGEIAASIIEEQIEHSYLDFEDIAKEQIERLDFADALNVATEKYVKNGIEEKISFSVVLKETIKEQIHLLEDDENNFMNLKDIVKEVASEKIDYNLNEEFDLKDLFKEVMEEKISEDFLLNSHQSLSEMVAQATREEFKKLLKPVYKNLKSLYFDIFNR